MVGEQKMKVEREEVEKKEEGGVEEDCKIQFGYNLQTHEVKRKDYKVKN